MNPNTDGTRRNRGKTAASKPRRRRPQVLVVAHPDGYLEAFGLKDEVEVLIVRPPTTDDPTGSILTEDYLESSLPHRWKDLFWPGNLLGALLNQPLPPSAIELAEWSRDFTRGLSSLVEKEAPPPPPKEPAKAQEVEQGGEVVTWIL